MLLIRSSAAISVALLICSGGAARAADVPLPSTEEVRAMVDARQYREALKPLFRLIALNGQAAMGYDRFELLMLRAECQLQLKDQTAVLGTLADARKEAFGSDKPERAAEPAALAYLLSKSAAYQYQPKGTPARRPISILDRTLRPAAYAALLADELPAATKRIEAANNAKSLGPVLEAAKLAGAMRALEVMSKADAQGGKLETDSLTASVTTNADRMYQAAIADMMKTCDAINTTANQIVNTQKGMYDPISKKSWFMPVTVRRGLTNQDMKTLNNIGDTCDKMHDSAVEMAMALVTDFATYKAVVDKATLIKNHAAAMEAVDYSVVPK